MRSWNGTCNFTRKIFRWRWWHDIKVFRLWFTLILLANFSEGEFEDITIERGSLATSLNSLSELTCLSVKEVRTALKKLERTGEIRAKSGQGSKYTIITVCNYDKYQWGQSKGKVKAKQGQSKGNQRATIEKEKEEKEEKEEVCGGSTHTFAPPTEEEVQQYADDNDLVIDAERFYYYYTAKGWEGIKDWKAKAREWDSKDRTEGKRKEVKGNNDYSILPSV